MRTNILSYTQVLFKNLITCLLFLQYLTPTSANADLTEYIDSKYTTPSDYIISDHPLVKNTALEAISGAQTAEEKARRLFDWVAANIQYEDAVYNIVKNNISTNSPEASLSRASDPLETLKRKLGVCGGISALLVSMFRSVGIPARQINGYYDQPEKIQEIMKNNFIVKSNHYWVEVYLNKKWIILEPTFAINNVSGGQEYQSYFDAEPNIFDQTHIRISEIKF